MSDSKKLEYDKEHETDGQMVLRISKKFAVLFLIIFFFDSLIDILSGVIDITLEIVHLIINFFEYSFELLLEHILNANHHESEVIIVNLAIVVAIYAIYRLVLLIPRLFTAIKKRMKEAWTLRQKREATCWHHLTMGRKIKVCSVYLVGTSLVLFFVTL